MCGCVFFLSLRPHLLFYPNLAKLGERIPGDGVEEEVHDVVSGAQDAVEGDEAQVAADNLEEYGDRRDG